MLPKELDPEAVHDTLAALDGSTLHERYLIRQGMRPIAALVSVDDLRRLETLEQLFARPTEREGPMALVGMFDDLSDEEIEEFIADVQAAREETRPVELGA